MEYENKQQNDNNNVSKSIKKIKKFSWDWADSVALLVVGGIVQIITVVMLALVFNINGSPDYIDGCGFAIIPFVVYYVIKNSIRLQNDGTLSGRQKLKYLIVFTIVMLFLQLLLRITNDYNNKMLRPASPAGNENVSNETQAILIDMEIAKLCHNINEICPMAIDKNRTLINVIPGPGRKVTYNISVPRLDSNLFTQNDIDEFTTKMHQAQIIEYKTNPQMDILRQYGVEIVKQYRDKNDKIFASISISPKDL